MSKKKRKMKIKKPSRNAKRLVMTFDASAGMKYLHSSQGAGEHKWIGTVSVGEPDGLCNEYDFTASSSITLQDFVRGLRENIAHVMSEASSSYVLKVYRRC